MTEGRRGRTHVEIDKTILTFLGQAYIYQGISDYGGSETKITPEEARSALQRATVLLETIAVALDA